MQTGQSISNDDVIEYDGKWYKVDGSGLLDISVASEDDLNAEVAAGNLSTGQLVQKDGNIEVFSAGGTSPSSSTATFEEIFNDSNGLTTDVTNEVTTIQDNGIWTQWGLPISDPLRNSNFASDKTSSFTDLSNKDIWSKTYYGSLNNISVNTDYQRGDNIFFEGALCLCF